MFMYFYQVPVRQPQISLVMVTGVNGSGRAVAGCLACCRWFCFCLLAWSVPRCSATVLWGISGDLCLLAALTMAEKADSLWFLVKIEFWV